MSIILSTDLARRVDAVRQFNRFYTRRIGVLQESYLRTPFSLAEARVLYELAQRQPATASQLARDLDLDAGYLSRILSRFRQRGLLDRTHSERDARESLLALTDQGRAVFAHLDSTQRDAIAALLSTLDEAGQRQLVGAMGSIGSLLGDSNTAEAPYIVRQHRSGDMGWIIQRHGALYAAEYGFDMDFEALVARIVARFIERYDPRLERCWIAEQAGEPVGCVFLVKGTKTFAKLRLFLVEPRARGVGLGTHLVDECIAFARAAGYRGVRLWTQSVLLAARHIYEKAGFKLIAEEPHHSFSQDLVAETWELRL